MSHTPAPWIVEHDEDKGTVQIWAGSAIEDRHKGTWSSVGCMNLYNAVYNDSEGDKECLANARLIAAAPDLLEALKANVDFLNWFKSSNIFTEGDSFFDILEALVNKNIDVLAKAEK